MKSRWLWIVVLVVLTGALGTGMWAWRRGRPERHLAEAVRALEADRPGEAATWLDAAERDPATRDRALVLRARIAVEQGRPSAAIEPLGRVDPRGKSGADAAFWKGRTLQAMNHPREAVAWFRQALTARPDDVAALRWMGVTSYHLGDRGTAIGALRELTRLRPDDAKAWRMLGLIYKEKARYEPAVAAYKASLKADPAQPQVRFELAETLVELKRYAEAEPLIAASRRGAAAADLSVLRAACRLGRGDRDGARAVLDAALADSPDHPALLGLRASIDRADGRLVEALDRLDLAISNDPYTSEWHYQRGLVLHGLGRNDEARDAEARARALRDATRQLGDLDNAAAQNPADPEVRERLGDLCMELGKFDLAASWYAAALACDPGRASARRALDALKSRQ